MKIKYDKEVDILYISFSDKEIAESDEVKPGIILDYDAEGQLRSMEVLNASKVNADQLLVDYKAA